MSGKPLPHDEAVRLEGFAQAHELMIWARALRSFFMLRNFPLVEASQSELLTHNWTPELRIAQGVLLRCSRLLLQLIHADKSGQITFEEPVASPFLEEFSPTAFREVAVAEIKADSWSPLAASLSDACDLCRTLLEAQQLDLHAWSSLGEVLETVLDRLEKSPPFSRWAVTQGQREIPVPLLTITQTRIKKPALAADMRAIFSRIFELLDILKHIENFLRSDYSLKQTLPLFTLVYEEGRALAAFIKSRPLRLEGIERHVSETLDSINYALTMELRKVFSHELVELGSLRQAPAIYIKVENAHGLLRDSFRQSAIGLAQLFDPTIEGSQLFDSFQTKLEQSLALRRDLWTLLQLVWRAEKALDGDSIRRLLDNLASFHGGSLRFLMFKDWETCEHFMEEVGGAREAAELAPILHRFAAYLEALGNQVSMRAVLVNHPFDFPELG